MKTKRFNKIIGNPIISGEIMDIFKSKFYMLRLVSEYKYFLTDGNGDLYNAYIFNSLEAGKAEYYIIELASLRGYYSLILINFIEQIFLYGRNTMLKLACLDYLIFNQNQINKEDYQRLNFIAKKHSSIELIKLQAEFNLAITAPFTLKKMESIYEKLRKTKDVGCFHRIRNILEEIETKVIKKKDIKIILKTLATMGNVRVNALKLSER